MEMTRLENSHQLVRQEKVTKYKLVEAIAKLKLLDAKILYGKQQRFE